MIANERQYRITKAQLDKFEEAIAVEQRRELSDAVDPRIRAAMEEALKSEAEELRRQLRGYEELREGHVRSRTLHSLRDLPLALIEARIASHTTQKGLANRLGVAEQQVQRWEATGYAGVNVERMQEVADALDAKVTEKVSFALANRPAGQSRTGRATAARGKISRAAPAKTTSRKSGRATTKSRQKRRTSAAKRSGAGGSRA